MAKYQKVEDIPMEEAGMPGVEVNGTYIQKLLTKEKDGAPNFAMRRFVIKPGGAIGLHGHWYEHEIFIQSGEGVMFGEDGVEHKVKSGDFVLMPGDEPHGYRNEREVDFVFLCVIPNPKEE